MQVKIDAAQLKEQEALRKQLQQEQDLLQTFQEAQDEKLKVQHMKERTALDEKVELSKKELEKEVCVREVVSGEEGGDVMWESCEGRRVVRLWRL